MAEETIPLTPLINYNHEEEGFNTAELFTNPSVPSNKRSKSHYD